MRNSELAIQFFRLGEQYAETAKLLLSTIIENENFNAGIGNTPEEAYQEMERNASKSDIYLFIPAIFNCLQSTELFIKGLLLLVGKSFEWKHGVEDLLTALKDSYGKDSDVYLNLHSFYKKQIKIIGKYTENNELTSIHDLYMSLRYPTIHPKDGPKKGSDLIVNYSALMYTSEDDFQQFQILLDKLIAVKLSTVKAYYSKEHKKS